MQIASIFTFKTEINVSFYEDECWSRAPLCQLSVQSVICEWRNVKAIKLYPGTSGGRNLLFYHRSELRWSEVTSELWPRWSAAHFSSGEPRMVPGRGTGLSHLLLTAQAKSSQVRLKTVQSVRRGCDQRDARRWLQCTEITAHVYYTNVQINIHP